jgi:hypothetical protein
VLGYEAIYRFADGAALPELVVYLATFVGGQEGNIFFADSNGAYFLPRAGRVRLENAKLLHTTNSPRNRDEAYVRFFRNDKSGPVAVAQLDDASICYVGQNLRNSWRAAAFSLALSTHWPSGLSIN